MSGILALEWSSRRVSAALSLGENREERVLEVERFRAPDALAGVDGLLRDCETAWRKVTEIRVGRGPGNFTGVRQAFAFAAGLSAPDRLPVRAVCCGVLIARAWADRVPEPFWILGDARRGLWWGARFPAERADWELATPETWRERLREAPVLSPDPERLHGVDALPAYPKAITLLEKGICDRCEPAEPLYLHAAV